jgi:hypothetical protein
MKLVALMGKMRNAYKILFRRGNGRDHLDGLGTSGKVILK